MPSSRKKLTVRRHPVVVDIGCGCRRQKLSSIFTKSALPIPKALNSSATTSASTSHTPTSTTTTSHLSSPSQSNSEAESSRKRMCSSIVEESEAVVKESSDPYLDFRESMLEMIVEKEIYAWEDLRALLHRFLELNSARHHHLILHAWNSLFWQSS